MRKIKVINVIMSVLIFYGLFYVISDFWKLLEMIIYKKTMLNVTDLIICLLFAFSLYVNLSHIIRRKTK